MDTKPFERGRAEGLMQCVSLHCVGSETLESVESTQIILIPQIPKNHFSFFQSVGKSIRNGTRLKSIGRLDNTLYRKWPVHCN